MTEEETAASARYGTNGLPGTDSSPGTDTFPGTGAIPGTGDARVDLAVARLGELADAPLEDHPVILGQIHDRLREVLGELGPDPANGPGSRGTP